MLGGAVFGIFLRQPSPSFVLVEGPLTCDVTIGETVSVVSLFASGLSHLVGYAIDAPCIGQTLVVWFSTFIWMVKKLSGH